MPAINKEALFEREREGLSAAEQRRKRHEYDPYSRRAINQSLQQMILGALHEVGGQKWLVRQADKYPVAFMALVSKMLPIESRNAGDGDIKIVVITSGNNEVVKSEARGVINTPLKIVSQRALDAQVTDADAREIDPFIENKRYQRE